jgi:hypothetical protein
LPAGRIPAKIPFPVGLSVLAPAASTTAGKDSAGIGTPAPTSSSRSMSITLDLRNGALAAARLLMTPAVPT